VGPVTTVDALSLYGKAKYSEYCSHFIPMTFKERLEHVTIQARIRQGRTVMAEEELVSMLNRNETTRKSEPMIYDKATDIWNANQGIKTEGGKKKKKKKDQNHTTYLFSGC
jgi:hypothetical protein